MTRGARADDLFEREYRVVTTRPARAPWDRAASYARACEYAYEGLKLFCAGAPEFSDLNGEDGEHLDYERTGNAIDIGDYAMECAACFSVCAFICWSGSLPGDDT